MWITPAETKYHKLNIVFVMGCIKIMLLWSCMDAYYGNLNQTKDRFMDEPRFLDEPEVKKTKKALPSFEGRGI